MDEFTEKHFQTWLDFTCNEDEREQVESSIRKLVSEYPDLTKTHSWPEMRFLAERNKEWKKKFLKEPKKREVVWLWR